MSIGSKFVTLEVNNSKNNSSTMNPEVGVTALSLLINPFTFSGSPCFASYNSYSICVCGSDTGTTSCPIFSAALVNYLKSPPLVSSFSFSFIIHLKQAKRKCKAGKNAWRGYLGEV